MHRVLNPVSGCLDPGEGVPAKSALAGTPVHNLDAVYREERSVLMRFVSRRAHSDDVEDIVQRAFYRLLRRNVESAPDSSGSYLRQIARNLILDDGRVQGRTQSRTHLTLEEADPVSCNTLAHLEARDRLARIEAALALLKPRTRDIFLACRVDGYSYAEVAQRTGLSVRGVEKQMSRAIKQLGRHLRPHD